MALNDVKEITIPEGSVKQIQDSNGNIIWGSQSAFPYRRLEYIKFSGAEYINTNVSLPSGNRYKRFDLSLDFQNSSNWGVNGFDSNTSNRFNIGVNGNSYARYGSGSTNTWQDSDGYYISLNTKYDFVLWASNGSTNLAIDQNGTNIWRSANRSISFTSATGNLYIGAINNNGSIASYCEEKVYSARLASGSYAGQLFLGIPCQRKSDGVCGLYDTQNNVFRPMIGTNITDAAAGPLVDEYWNLQA